MKEKKVVEFYIELVANGTAVCLQELVTHVQELKEYC